MKERAYLSAARIAAILSMVLAVTACRGLSPAESQPDGERLDKVERVLSQVEATATAAKAATAEVPGFGSVSAIAALIAAAATAVHGAWRNQTRRTDPAVANSANGSTGAA